MSATDSTLSDSRFLDAIRSVRWPARRKTRAGLVGGHLSRILGASAEFTEYRAYRYGDESRRIDWKLLARSNRAYIKLSNERTVVSTMLFVDASGSLAYPSATLEKWHYARRLALGLASAAHAGGDPVGLVIATEDGPLRFPPRSRRGVVSQIAHTLNGVTPAGSSPLGPLLRLLRSAGRIAIISDFLGSAGTTGRSEAATLLSLAAELTAAGREVHAVHVLHANEIAPPRRTALLTDPEDAAFKRPLTDATLREYDRTFGMWREQLARDWRMAGAYYNAVSTADPVAHALRRVTIGRP